MKNKKTFENYVFESFKESDSFDKIFFRFTKIFNLINENNKFFTFLTPSMQFDLCITVYMITVNSQHDSILTVMSKSKEGKDLKYSIDEGFEEPVVISNKADRLQLLNEMLLPRISYDFNFMPPDEKITLYGENNVQSAPDFGEIGKISS